MRLSFKLVRPHRPGFMDVSTFISQKLEPNVGFPRVRTDIRICMGDPG